VRAWPIAVAAVAAALLVSGCAATSRAPAAHPAPAKSHFDPATVVRTFAAYDAAGRLTVPVAAHRGGHCWSASIAVLSAGAYRCFAGNTILDPCFAPPDAAEQGTVACIADPWSSAVVLRLTAPLPKDAGARSAERPWAIVLQTGIRCVASTGTVPAVDKVNLPYHCNDGTSAALTTRAGPHLHASEAAPGATTLRRAAVRVVWRG
jgi:hypothetical protein